MKKRTIVLSILLISVFVVSSFADDSAGRRAKAPALRIGFSEAYSPQPGFTLTGSFSKLKQYLEAEFGATVTSVGSWSSSALNSIDVLIIPGRWQAIPPDGHLFDLRDWIKEGGCVILLFHPRGQDYQFTHPDRYAFWQPSIGIHDKVLNAFGIGIKQLAASDNDIRTFASPFDSSPYSVNLVNDGGPMRTAWINKAESGAKFLGWNGSGQAIAAYHQNIGTGKGSLFVLCNTYYFHNLLIDTADNKEFLFNLIDACGGDGGGGGGGGTGVILKKVKGRPGVVAPGNDIKLIARVKNTDSSASAITDIEFYFSSDQVLDASDTFIDSAGIPSLNPGKGKRIKIIGEVPVLDDGFYYIIGKVLSSNDVKESKKQVEVR